MSKRKKKNRKAENQLEAKAVEETTDDFRAQVSETQDIRDPARLSAGDPVQIESVWRLGIWVILVAAFLLRFFWLTLKPFHHDEGVNGFFLTGLFRDGLYKYDPSNYHGPSLYYFALLSSYLFGLDDFAVRLVTAVFGILTVALVFSLRRYLGTIGTLFAATLVALSPGLTFFSRYFIHEILLVFFTFAFVVAVLKFLEGERPGVAAIIAMAILLGFCLVPIGLQIASLTSPDDQVTLLVLRFILTGIATAIVFL